MKFKEIPFTKQELGMDLKPVAAQEVWGLSITSGRMRVIDYIGRKVPGQHHIEIIQEPVQARHKRCTVKVRLYCALETGHDVCYYSKEKNMLFSTDNQYMNVPTECVQQHAEQGFAWVDAVFECRVI